MYSRSFRGSSFSGRNRFRRPSFQRIPRFKKINEALYVKKAPLNLAQENFIAQRAFTDLSVDQTLKNNILRRGFEKMTLIQDQTINHILDGKDVIGIANTGTGKTAAFLIPLLDRIVKNKTSRALIIVPTRELAMQIRDEIRSFSSAMNIYSSLCIGGAFIRNQIYELQRNPHFVIGTPGRLKDLVQRKSLFLDKFNTIVLDEVDRMLDMGFIRDIKLLLSMLPKVRQSLFFAATVSNEINGLIAFFLIDPIKISVKLQDTTENVEQDVVRIQPGMTKIGILENMLKKDEFKKVMIFGGTKRGVERLSISLYQKGFKVASIHGDKPQSKRTQAIRLFKENVVNILVATDVAARGIDVLDITHVINYDVPMTYVDYIHRIGRTGRAGKRGAAFTFVE